MISIDDCELISSDVPAGGGATLDLYFDHQHGFIIEVKTTCDVPHLHSETPIADAIQDFDYDQTIAVAEAILRICTRQDEQRPMTFSNKRAFDKLVAEIHYSTHELKRIKEAIEDYYYPG